MCQCQEATINPYPSYDNNPYPYEYPYDPNVSYYDPYAYPAPAPPPPEPVVPYPTVVYPLPPPPPIVTYDPYWPSRVTPSHRPLLLVSPMKRFRGEIRQGNCLIIVE
ncbi:MAG TPA: hypothetical protein VLV31_00880 [Candidatus Acidoferrales bacterium]|nr:hypothetical protein [Candidatus Acidoferrales bacterium]